MKILNWNIQSGGGARVPGILERISHHAPDLAILPEFHNDNSAGAALQAGLTDLGLSFQQMPVNRPGNNNTVLLASRLPLTALDSSSFPLAVQQRFVAVQVAGLNLAGAFCNVPQTGKDLFAAIAPFWQSLSPQPFLLTGDLYFGPQGSNPKNYRQLNPLLEQGLVDSWRHHKGEVIEWSFRNSRGGCSQPDHCFVSPNLLDRVTAVSYSLAELEARLSDHAPMVIELDWDIPGG